MPLILLDTSPVSEPNKSTPTKNTGTSSQLRLMLYHSRKPTPTSEENSTLINELINRSASVFTFCKTESVVPLLLSSNSWKESRKVCFNPSLKIFIPKRATALRVIYSWDDLQSLDKIARPNASASHESTPCISLSSGSLFLLVA